MSNKDVVKNFFIEGYQNHNYDYVMEHVAADYIDHSPANARSNKDAVGILRIVENMFTNLKIEILDLFQENEMVAVRVLYTANHTGICMGIKGNGKEISFEALENFKVIDGIITESWGYWPDAQIEKLLKE